MLNIEFARYRSESDPVTMNISGERVALRFFRSSDADRLQKLAGDRAVAENRRSIPHPYPDGLAQQWIASLKEPMSRGNLVSFAVVIHSTKELIGNVSLRIEQEFERGILSYWIGAPYWGNGYCTEATRMAVRYGFEVLDLNRIYAWHLPDNPASGRVLEKLGMQLEGRQRQHRIKNGEFTDLILYGVLREDWDADWASHS
jgi:RimJ/RimL family protein N-acetyltransferase